MIHKVIPQWFAAYTRSRTEKKVAEALQELGIEYYLPLYRTIRQWSDRKKKIEEPLIRSYIFVRIVQKEYLPVLQVSGVVKIVQFAGNPVPIPDWQINNLKILLGAGILIENNGKEFKKGEEVVITHGSLEGLKGVVARSGNRTKLIISITAIKYNILVDIEPGFVEAVK